MSHYNHPDNHSRNFMPRERPHAPYQSPPLGRGGTDDLDRLAAEMDVAEDNKCFRCKSMVLVDVDGVKACSNPRCIYANGFCTCWRNYPNGFTCEYMPDGNCPVHHRQSSPSENADDVKESK